MSSSHLPDRLQCCCSSNSTSLYEAASGGDRLEPVLFFRRRAVEGGDRSCGYCPESCLNLDEFLFMPVAASHWRQHELRDGTYTLDVLLDIVELIRVRRENESRAMEARQ